MKFFFRLVCIGIILRAFAFGYFYNQADTERSAGVASELFLAQDSVGGFIPAVHLANGEGYSNHIPGEAISPETNRGPVFAILVLMTNTLFGFNDLDVARLRNLDLVYLYDSKAWIPIVVLNHIFGIMAVIVFFKILELLFRNSKISFWGAAFYAISFEKIKVDNAALVDAFLILLLLTIYLKFLKFIEKRKISDLIFCGLLISVAALTKPITMILWAAFGSGIIVFLKTDLQSKIKFSIILISLSLIGPMAWTFRNGNLTGVYSLSDLQNYAWFHHVANRVKAKKDGQTLRVADQELEDKFAIELKKHEVENSVKLNLQQSLSLKGKFGLDYVKQNFGTTVLLYLEALPPMLFGLWPTNFSAGRTEMFLRWYNYFLNLLIVGFAVLGAVEFFVLRRRFELWILGVPALMLIFLSLPLYAIRYRVAFYPMLILLGIGWAGKKLRKA